MIMRGKMIQLMLWIVLLVRKITIPRKPYTWNKERILTLLQGSPWEGLAMEVRVHPNLHLATASAQVLSGSGEIVDIKLCWPGFLRDGVSSLLRFPTINNIPDTSTWFNGLLALKL